MKTKFKQKRKKLIAAIAAISLFASFLPFNLGYISSQSTKASTNYTNLEGDIRWTPADNPGTFEDDMYFIEGSLTIEAGTHLRLRDNSMIHVDGDLFIEGGENNPVVFEGVEDIPRYNYSLVVENGEQVNVNHAVFRRGGGNSCSAQAPELWNFALADDGCVSAALDVSADEVVIKNSTFDHNLRAINYFDGGDDSYLSGNIFHHNTDSALYSKADYELDARDNCWMRPSGPQHPGNPNGLGEKIEGNIDFSDWRECGTDHQPVLIIPGIGGSWNWDVLFGDVFLDKWNFPPIVHDYDSLIESFKEKGYEQGKDLQIVFYDWRKDNHQSAEQFLAPVINNLKEISFDEKYDIVAHSMGGIVAMDYLRSHGNGMIDKTIFLGTPLGGSAKAYPVWEGGVIPNDWWTMRWYLKILKAKNIEIGKDNFDLVHEHIPSVKQLLPIYDYVIPDGAGDPAAYAEMHEYNEYLDDLFQYSVNNLFGENTLMIEGTGLPTSKMIDVRDYTGENEEKIWKDGEPKNNPLLKDETQGDGTVVNTRTVFDAIAAQDPWFPYCEIEKLSGIKHTQLPAAAIAKVHDFLFGEPPVHGDYPFPGENKLIFAFASPVDVKIIAPDEKFVTKDQNTIGETFAHYYSDGQADGAKIVEIQDPLAGVYKIELTGNGDGEYHILATKQDGDEYTDAEKEGIITENQIINYAVDSTQENIEIQPGQNADTTPPAISVTSPEDQKTYLNDQIVPVDYSITEETTAGENITKNVQLDGQDFSENKIDLSLQSLGEHKLKITATDEAGNKSEKETIFQTTTGLDAIQNNLNHYFDLKLIKNKIAKRYFSVRLRNIENLFNLLEKTENSKLKPKPRQAAVDALKKVINADINLLVRQINRKSPHWIDQAAEEFLIEDLNFIRP